MIIKSMSRKEPSFGQLVAYMSDEKSDRAFDLHHHVFTRDPGDVAAEFEDNARRLGKRKGGNYLFHEILSLDTRECGQGRDVKEKLRLLAFEYIERRCARNMVYGAMHRDHEGHLHYHLMISVNERGEKKRLRFSPSQFDQTKREMERYSREIYPELKQPEVMDVSREERDERRDQRKSQKQHEMEKRGAKLTKKEQLAQELRGMMAYASSQAEFERLLHDRGFTLRQNGKNWVIDPISREDDSKKPKPHRFSTLGIHADYEEFLEQTDPVIEDERLAGEKEKQDGVREERVASDGQTSYDQQQEDENQSEANNNGEDMGDLRKPSGNRREMIDKGHVTPDPERDLMSLEEWDKQDTGLNKMQQSWRRTMDDFRGRTKDLEGRARSKGDDDAEQER